jgi:hypothetical protein
MMYNVQKHNICNTKRDPVDHDARSKAGIMVSNPNQGMDVCVCVYPVFVLSCMQVAAKESNLLCKKDCETEEEDRAQQSAVEPLMNE